MRVVNLFKDGGYICRLWKDAQMRYRPWDEVSMILFALWEIYSVETPSVSRYLWFLAKVAEVHFYTDRDELLKLKQFEATKALMQ